MIQFKHTNTQKWLYFLCWRVLSRLLLRSSVQTWFTRPSAWGLFITLLVWKAFAFSINRTCIKNKQSMSQTPGRDSGFLAALRLLVGVVSSVPVYSPEAQSTLSSTPVPHHAINSPIKASSTFQSPPDRCTAQYEYMPANLCPEISVFGQFLRNWELTRFSLSWLQNSSLNLGLRSLTRTLEHRVLEPGPQTLYPTRTFTTQFTSLFVLVVNKLTVTQCQPENTHGEFQPSNRNELLPKSPPFHANGWRSTDPITNALVQRYGRLREWLWTPSWLHS